MYIYTIKLVNEEDTFRTVNIDEIVEKVNYKLNSEIISKHIISNYFLGRSKNSRIMNIFDKIDREPIKKGLLIKIKRGEVSI
jgi:hypothetical protein